VNKVSNIKYIPRYKTEINKAMLYFLEILMNSSTPYTISQLAGRFGSRNFTPDMRQCAGGNEAGLKKFLQKYPSLFAKMKPENFFDV
jgi:exonuclease 3'-5' domain-containing protein 1